MDLCRVNMINNMRIVIRVALKKIDSFRKRKNKRGVNVTKVKRSVR